MSATAIILIVSSAFFHAAWNFIGKRQNPSIAFFFIASIAAAIILSPLLLIYGHALPGSPTSVWILILITGVAQAVYYSGLAGAYNRGDLSLAYPLARALPILLIAVISMAAGKGSDIGRLC